MLTGLVIHKIHPTAEPHNAQQSKDIECRWPAAQESLGAQPAGQWHRYNRANVGARINDRCEFVALQRRYPMRQHGVHGRIGDALAHPLQNADQHQQRQIPMGRQWCEQCKDGRDEDSIAIDPFAAHQFGHATTWHLGQHIAIEEAAQDQSLCRLIPHKFTLDGHRTWPQLWQQVCAVVGTGTGTGTGYGAGVVAQNGAVAMRYGRLIHHRHNRHREIHAHRINNGEPKESH